MPSCSTMFWCFPGQQWDSQREYVHLSSLHFLACARWSKPGGAAEGLSQARSLPGSWDWRWVVRKQLTVTVYIHSSGNAKGRQHSSGSDSKSGPRNGMGCLALLAQMFCFRRLAPKFLILSGLRLSPQCSFIYTIFLIVNLERNFFR